MRWTFLLLAWFGLLIAACAGDGCPRDTMKARADAYLDAQVCSNIDPNCWNFFDSILDADVKLESNVVTGPGAVIVGIDAVKGVVHGIGKDYQRIAWIASQPINTVKKNQVVARFVKGQGALSYEPAGAGSGIYFNLSFVHIIEFNDACNITLIDERADFAKTENSLPVLVPDIYDNLCFRLAVLCEGASISWGSLVDGGPGNMRGKCHQYLSSNHIPAMIKDDGVGGSLGFFPLSNSLICRTGILGRLENHPEEAPFSCPLLGAPDEPPTPFGCWTPPAARRRSEEEPVPSYARWWFSI